MTKPESKPPQRPAESDTPTGGDATMSLLRKARLPVTRENYLQFANFGHPPVSWTAEHERELPKELQDPRLLSGRSAPPVEIPPEYRAAQKRFGLTDQEVLDWMDVT